jgi:hypothetical protein
MGTWRAQGGAPWLGFLDELSAGASAELLVTFLRDFTWAGKKPDDTVMLLPSLSASGRF